jgi:hypothetical protein
MRRITVSEVKAAYEKCGIKPINRTFKEYGTFDSVCAGCAVTALAGSQGVDIVCTRAGELRRWAEQKYGQKYTGGFLGGFDRRLDRRYFLDSEDETMGWDDGRAAAAAIFGESA